MRTGKWTSTDRWDTRRIANRSGLLINDWGKAICEELKVQLQANWPDYVFAKEYKLQPLEKLEQEIKDLGHLPGMPAAAEVEANGVEVGEMQRMMMEKIEELTLYVIELQKENLEIRKQLRDVSQSIPETRGQ